MMTQRDFKLIAAALGKSRDNLPADIDQHTGFAAAVEGIGEALKGDNPRFNHRRFVDVIMDY